MILIIDDDVSVCKSAVLSLRMEGFQAEYREGYAAARPRLAQASLVFLDITMPETCGIMALKEIRKDYPGLAVVMFTGVADLDTAVECLKMGAVDYLAKPVEAETLIASVLEHLPVRTDQAPFLGVFHAERVEEIARMYEPGRFVAQAGPEAAALAGWLAEKYTDPDCSLQNAAQELGTNTTYLYRTVVSEWNMPFRQLVNTMRLASFLRQACQDQDETRPLKALAAQAGWMNKSTFFGTVKYLTGLTPLELKALCLSRN